MYTLHNIPSQLNWADVWQTRWPHHLLEASRMLLKLIPVNLAWWYSTLSCWNNWSPWVVKQYNLVLRSLNMFRWMSRFNTPYVNIIYTIMKWLSAYIVPCWQLGSIPHLNPTISPKHKELWFNWPHCMLPVLQHCLSWAQCCGVNRGQPGGFSEPILHRN